MTRITIVLPALLLASCALLAPARVESVYHRNEQVKGGYARVTLAGLEVEKGTGGGALRENARYIFELLDARYTRERVVSGALRAEVFLKEQTLLLGLETRSAVTLEIRLSREGSQEAEILYFFSEETTRSLSSDAYLYRIIEGAFRRIFP